MLNSPDHFTRAARVQLESQLNFATAVTDSLINSTEQLAGLQLQAIRASIEASLGQLRDAMSSRDTQTMLATTPGALQPHADIAMTYGKHLASIASSFQRDMSGIAQSHISRTSRDLVATLDELGQTAPAGSDGVLNLMKSAIDNANSSYEQFARSATVTVDAVESNLQAAGTQLTQLSSRSNGRTKKA